METDLQGTLLGFSILCWGSEPLPLQESRWCNSGSCPRPPSNEEMVIPS